MADSDQRVTVLQALKELGALKARLGEFGLDTDHFATSIQTLTQFIAERAVSSAPSDNSGLPCEYCGEKQKKIVLERIGEDLVVRVNVRVGKKDFTALLGILKAFKDK